MFSNATQIKPDFEEAIDFNKHSNEEIAKIVDRMKEKGAQFLELKEIYSEGLYPRKAILLGWRKRPEDYGNLLQTHP